MNTDRVIILSSDFIKQKSNKITSLQTLRGIAFLGIASFHCGLSLFGPLSVSIFFVMSGFLMMYSYMNKPIECSLKNNVIFSLRKIKKLYPLYLITTLAMVIIHKSFSLKILAIDLLLVQSWIPNPDVYYSLNGVAWFFSDMLFIYMMFPLIKKGINKYKEKKNAVIVLIGIILALSSVTVLSRIIGEKYASTSTVCTWIEYVFPVTRLGDFAAGCNLGYIFVNSKNNYSKFKASVLELVAVFATCISQIVYYINAKAEISDHMSYINLPVAILCVYLFTVNGGIFTKACSNKLLVFIGNLSGQAFLIHRPIADLLYNIIKINGISHRIYDIIVFSISILITVAISVIYTKTEKAIKCRLGNRTK